MAAHCEQRSFLFCCDVGIRVTSQVDGLIVVNSDLEWLGLRIPGFVHRYVYRGEYISISEI